VDAGRRQRASKEQFVLRITRSALAILFATSTLLILVIGNINLDRESSK
jgi:hypothetical protein